MNDSRFGEVRWENGGEVPLTVQAHHDQFRAQLIGHCQDGRRDLVFAPGTVHSRHVPIDSAAGRNDHAARRPACQQAKVLQKGVRRFPMQDSRSVSFEHMEQRDLPADGAPHYKRAEPNIDSTCWNPP